MPNDQDAVSRAVGGARLVDELERAEAGYLHSDLLQINEPQEDKDGKGNPVAAEECVRKKQGE